MVVAQVGMGVNALPAETYGIVVFLAGWRYAPDAAARQAGVPQRRVGAGAKLNSALHGFVHCVRPPRLHPARCSILTVGAPSNVIRILLADDRTIIRSGLKLLLN